VRARILVAVGFLATALIADSASAQKIEIVAHPFGIATPSGYGDREATTFQIESGESARLNILVNVTASSFGCNQGAKLRVNLTSATGSGSSDTNVSFLAPFIEFPIPPNQPFTEVETPEPAPGGPYRAGSSVGVTIRTTARNGTSVERVSLTASYPGGMPEQCGSTGTNVFPASSDSVEYQITLLPVVGLDGENATTEADEQAPPTTSTNPVPGLDPWLIAMVGITAAWSRRRERG
jgi:hypothetical protein